MMSRRLLCALLVLLVSLRLGGCGRPATVTSPDKETRMNTKTVGNHTYQVEPLLVENFENLERWVTLEQDGKWEVKNGGLEGEWLQASPSIFLKEKITGDYLWEVEVTRLETDAAFLERYTATKWGKWDPREQYNFNFWLRADVPPNSPGDFFSEYPKYLKTGWNGMGDDHWHSYFTTVVWNPEDNWVRLRRGPGYELRQDVHNVAPFMPWGEKHKFTFVLQGSRVRCYVDDRTLVYDYEDPAGYREGHIGLCVWLCKVRFEKMRVWRVR
jgi:hypothetical protein